MHAGAISLEVHFCGVHSTVESVDQLRPTFRQPEVVAHLVADPLNLAFCELSLGGFDKPLAMLAQDAVGDALSHLPDPVVVVSEGEKVGLEVIEESDPRREVL